MAKAQIIAGLEIAHAKLRIVILENGSFLYASEVECVDGMRKGVVINLDNVTEAIQRLLEDVDQKTGRKINSVFVNIGGPNIRQETVSSVNTFLERGHEITRKNADDLIESSRLVSIPADRTLLYLLPLEYILDGQDGIRDPVGLCGNRLEARLSIITAPFNQVQNITKAVNAAGLEIKELILTPLANAASILNIEEKKEGSLLIDFKTDMTESAIFKEGALIFFETISKGQEAITSELAAKFNIPNELSEELKKKYGFLGNTQQDRRSEDTLPLEWMGSRQQIPRGELSRFVNDQHELLFDSISERLKGLKNLGNIIKRGAVLNGGCAATEGFLERAAQKFGFTTRLGILRQDAGHLENRYIASWGLASIGLEKERKAARWNGEGNFFAKVYQKAGELLTEYF